MKKAKVVVVAGLLVLALCIVFAWAVPFNAASGNMVAARGELNAVVLPDGKVLITGGIDDSLTVLSSAEVYTTGGTFIATGGMHSARYLHSAITVTAGGVRKVLVTGGYDGVDALGTADLYTPSTGVFTALTMSVPRYSHAATELQDGTVLITGGSNSTGVLNSYEIYTPAATFSESTGTYVLNVARKQHTATLLADGSVLVVGGSNGTQGLKSAETYSPGDNSFTVASAMTYSRIGHTATLLQDGRVLVAGGSNGADSVNTAEIYDPATGNWTTTGTSMTAKRANHTATLLADGSVLFTGGSNNAGELSSAEIYYPVADEFYATTVGMTSPRLNHAAALLADGTVLIAGGYVSGFSQNTAEIFDTAQDISATTTALAASRATSYIGSSITFTATVTGENTHFSYFGGDVVFSDGSTTLVSRPVSTAGIATYTTTNLALGDHLITAVYTGNRHYGTSTSDSLAPQTVSLNTTTLGLVSSKPTSTVGQNVVFTATVTRVTNTTFVAGGTMIFSDGTTSVAAKPVVNGVATYSAATLTAGNHSITASYLGDSHFDVSTATVSQDVNLNNTAINLIVSKTAIGIGTPVNVTATVTKVPVVTVTPFDGNVYFFSTISGTTTTLGISSMNSSGVATFSTSMLDIGINDITASYVGNTSYNTSVSSSATKTVGVYKKPTRTQVSSPGAIKLGDQVTFTATVSQNTATGSSPYLLSGTTVTFKKDGVLLGTAILSGDTVTATATFDTNVTTHPTFTGAGSYVISAEYGGLAGSYLSSSGSFTQVVGYQDATITLGDLTGQLYSATTMSPSITTVPDGLASFVTLSYRNASGYVIPSSAGTYTVTAIMSHPTRTAITTGVFVIGQRPLTIEGMTADTKVYDGTSVATFNTTTTRGHLVGVQGSDTLIYNVYGTFADATIGTSKVVSVSTITVAGSTYSGNPTMNYTISPFSVTGDITAKPLTITGMKVSDKSYDGTTNASVSASVSTPTATKGRLVGVVSGETITWTPNLQFALKTAGTRSVIVSSIDLIGATAGNYTVTKPTGLTATISKATVTVTATGIDKIYDKTKAAKVTLTPNGVVSGESVVLSYTTATFASTGVAPGITVYVAGVKLNTSAAALNYTLSPSYLSTTTTASITQKSVTAVGLKAQTKTYDLSSSATLTSLGKFTVSGVVSGDTVTFRIVSSVSCTFDDAKAGTSKPVTVGSGAVILMGPSVANYKLGSQAVTGTINPKALTAGLGSAAVTTRSYDRTSIATITGVAVTALGSDTVTVDSTTGAFNNKNAGTGKVVTISKVTLGGADAANYTVTKPTATLSGVITKATLTVNSIVATKKVYNGNTAAKSIVSFRDNRFTGDALTISASTCSFATPTVGTSKVVSAGSWSFTGADAANYVMTSGMLASTLTTTADITPKALTISGLRAISQAYNGSSTVASFSTVTLVGIVGSDSVTSSITGTSTFANANVGTSKVVTLGTITWSGPDAGNYTVTKPASVVGNITARPLAITVEVSSKMYDGSTTASATFTPTNVIAGDNVTVSGTAAFATAASGLNKTVTVTSLTKSGTSAANYSLPALSSFTGLVADIY